MRESSSIYVIFANSFKTYQNKHLSKEFLESFLLVIRSDRIGADDDPVTPGSSGLPPRSRVASRGGQGGAGDDRMDFRRPHRYGAVFVKRGNREFKGTRIVTKLLY